MVIPSPRGPGVAHSPASQTKAGPTANSPGIHPCPTGMGAHATHDIGLSASPEKDTATW